MGLDVRMTDTRIFPLHLADAEVELPIFAQTHKWAMVHEPEDMVPEWVDFPSAWYEPLDGEPEVSGADDAWDANAYAASVRRLRDLEPRRVHFVHDTVWEHR